MEEWQKYKTETESTPESWDCTDKWQKGVGDSHGRWFPGPPPPSALEHQVLQHIGLGQELEEHYTVPQGMYPRNTLLQLRYWGTLHCSPDAVLRKHTKNITTVLQLLEDHYTVIQEHFNILHVLNGKLHSFPGTLLQERYSSSYSRYTVLQAQYWVHTLNSRYTVL